MDILNLISLVVGTAIGIGGILIGYKIAKKSGAFRQIMLDVSLMNQSLIRDPQFSEVIFGYSVDEEDIALCILPFGIKNNGELSAKNVAIRFVFPLVIREFKGLAFKDNLLDYMDIFGSYDKSEIKRRSYKYGGFQYVDYVIPEINPRQYVVIEEAIDITNASGMPFKVKAISKDGVPLEVNGHLGWLVQIDVGLSANDVEPIEGHFQVRSYQAQNREELGERIMKDETQVVREGLSKIGAPKEFISNAYAPGVSKKAIVIMPKLKKIPKPKEYSAIKRSIYQEEPEKSERWVVTPERDVKKVAYK